ncbi:ABC transporter permease [Planococcus ruber]|uniref:lmo0954 family membrane protein n=1 Tax=Planococcus ruber TaxID=2027871 RepID=UPI001FEDC273|nr:ABC transporter permease [Planococcus ruber]MCJ1908067.1 ABC transporter permease [Planococcus ruber]
MNKFWMITLGAIAGIIVLSNLGAIAGLAISGLILYMGVHYYLKSTTTAAKIWWGFVGAVGVLSAISNIPALIGVAAAFGLWMIYRKWNEQPVTVAKTDDPFTNFEKQWNKLSK